MTKKEVIQKLRSAGYTNISYSGKDQTFYATSSMGVRKKFDRLGNTIKVMFEGTK